MTRDQLEEGRRLSDELIAEALELEKHLDKSDLIIAEALSLLSILIQDGSARRSDLDRLVAIMNPKKESADEDKKEIEAV